MIAHAFITYTLRGELEDHRQLQPVRLRRETSSCDLVQGISIDFDITRNTCHKYSLWAAARKVKGGLLEERNGERGKVEAKMMCQPSASINKVLTITWSKRDPNFKLRHLMFSVDVVLGLGLPSRASPVLFISHPRLLIHTHTGHSHLNARDPAHTRHGDAPRIPAFASVSIANAAPSAEATRSQADTDTAAAPAPLPAAGDAPAAAPNVGGTTVDTPSLASTNPTRRL
jgi:hypothetical protein